MKNKVLSDADKVVYSNSSTAIASGDVVVIGNRIGVASVDIAQDDEGVVELYGAFELDKATGAAWAVGDPLFWDNSAKKLTKVGLGNIPAGFAQKAAGSSATSGVVNLNAVPFGKQAAVVAALTSTSGGTANGALEDEGVVTTSGGNTYSDSAVNTVIGKVKNNIAELATNQASILSALKAAGLMASS